MNYRAIVDQRREALFAQWTADPGVLVSSPSAADLQTRSIGLAMLRKAPDALGVSVGSLPPTAKGLSEAVVLRLPGQPDHTGASLWVPAGMKDYRAAFTAFLSAQYGGRCESADLEGYDVDHLLNKKRATTEEVLIRVEAVPASVNRAWGSLFERNASNPSFHANQVRAARSMSWAIAAKLIGRLPPRGPDDAPAIRDLAAFFARYPAVGQPAGEIADQLTSMLAFAHRHR